MFAWIVVLINVSFYCLIQIACLPITTVQSSVFWTVILLSITQIVVSQKSADQTATANTHNLDYM